MRPFICLLACLFACVPLSAQKLSGVPYPVGYEIQKMGWPSKLAAIPGGRFFYVEFWKQGPGKPTTGYYLQSVKPQMTKEGEEFVEAWSVLTHKPQDPFIDVNNVIATEKSVAIMGRITPKGSAPATVIQYFDMAGQLLGAQQYLSPYRKNIGNYEDSYYMSPDGSKLLWLGYNPAEPAKKRVYYAAVYSDDGRKVWSGELNPAGTQDRLIATDAAVDNTGNLYLGMADESPTGGEPDKAFAPKVLRYDYKTKQWQERKLEFEGHTCLTVRLQPLADDMLGVVALMMDGDKGFPNQLNSGGKQLYWSSVGWTRLHLRSQDLASKGSFQEPVTPKMAAKYKSETLGARFGQFRFLEKGGKLYLLAEQSWDELRSGGQQYFRHDVAMLGIDVATDKLLWMNLMDKEQTDYSPAMISYVPALTDMFIHMVYMSDVGGGGKMMLASVNRETGEHLKKELATNERGNLLFFTRRSVQTEPQRLVLLGMGDPKKNEYLILQIKPLP
ncbi:MAG: hypothetical protein KF690_02715 [Bacteroidetes bacterium]|nr:hypothetical protein [Bacteroidota bacterium]